MLVTSTRTRDCGDHYLEVPWVIFWDDEITTPKGMT